MFRKRVDHNSTETCPLRVGLRNGLIANQAIAAAAKCSRSQVRSGTCLSFQSAGLSGGVPNWPMILVANFSENPATKLQNRTFA